CEKFFRPALTALDVADDLHVETGPCSHDRDLPAVRVCRGRSSLAMRRRVGAPGQPRTGRGGSAPSSGAGRGFFRVADRGLTVTRDTVTGSRRTPRTSRAPWDRRA